MNNYEGTPVKRDAGVTMKHIDTAIKSVALEGTEGSEAGVFTGYASVFGNVDSYGEVVVKGAFADSLAEQKDFPVYWSHQMSDPMMNLGKTLEIREDDHGLFVKAQLDLDTPMGAQVYRLIKDGRVGQMSFAFDVQDYAFAHDDERGEYVELRKLKLHEVSVVQVGANQATELLGVKTRVSHVQGGRPLTKADGDRLMEAARLIDEVLAEKSEGRDEAPALEDDDSEESEPTSEGEKSRTFDPDAALANLYIITEGA